MHVMNTLQNPTLKGKVGFTGLYIMCLILAHKHRLWDSLEPPELGGSNEYSQPISFSPNVENNVYPAYQLFHILVGFSKCSSHRLVNVMGYIIPGVFMKSNFRFALHRHYKRIQEDFYELFTY